MRFVVICFMLLIVASMGSALLFLLRDRGTSGTRMVRALSWRVGLSIGLFLLLMLGFATGFIQGRL
ncbi:twin transmembrane helix small protein [Azoarcus taiwanensis]|mgnify:CR=1 FL=1|uniref:Twin transmembrane helix small protein n=1 Tax=Azoarcus taiwanensis TaxID=666964 RepID=A0A972FIN8_9RHOO|nr:twin transmembrane helix small protein [Azoarcus taiwanensis]NMG03016.1 twin transmembrane helix small protein [Azoarcus taiwanensis]